MGIFGLFHSLNKNQTMLWLMDGVKLYEAGEYAKALASLQKVLDAKGCTEKERASAYNFQGGCYKEMRLLDEAIEAYLKAIECNPQSADYWTNLGICYRLQGKDQKALETYEKSMQIDPENANTWGSMSVIFNNFGEYDKAISYCEKAIELAPGNGTNYGNAAIFCARAGDFDKAEEYLQKAIRVGYNNIERARKSIEECKTSARMESEGRLTFFSGMQKYNNDDFAAAIEIFKEVLEKKQDMEYRGHTYFYLADSYMCLGLPEFSASVLQDALTEGENAMTVKSFRLLAVAYFRTDRNEEAEHVLLDTIAKYPEEADLYFDLGQYYNRIQKFMDAAVNLKKAIELNPNKAYYYDSLTYTYACAGEFSMAEATLETAKAKGSTQIAELQKIIDTKRSQTPSFSVNAEEGLTS